MNKILVIIPTYNEADNIQKIIPEVLKNSSPENEFNVLVVDDNSPDGTAELAESLNNSNVKILKREKKSGLGTAYLAGFKYAIKNNYDYVFEMDADFSHDPKYLKVFIDKILEGYDLVIGSRYINGISVLNWPLRRLIMSYLASVYTRMVTGLKVMDTTAGFMCYRVTSLKQINLDEVRSNGYSFQIEMKFKFYKRGYKIFEVPILFIDRREGESKMSRKVVYEAYFMVWKLKIKSIFGKI
ncbi:MAG: polyprenol monophosphomannose synthase [Ignavibacteria bacterium]|nr:polyprenol monophosphomannose synthase [Ignavibacteria bacterium]MBK7445889.1 polyprenol monophosphomannose synthase [Ignavibacteria bacterium]MBK8381636.1 polyprenol monophosphomannose synthase [Ignavibacteria bacterium]MBK9404734.1 polyprenol monophosphomannose synthase [Ignavibacteria bacterium]